jgi:hypothetical protein
MHSMPAMYTLPIRVQPSKHRSLTLLVVLLIFFAAAPPLMAQTYTGCRYGLPSHNMMWLWSQEPVPQLPENTGRLTAAGMKQLRQCYEVTKTPWWAADSITH